MPGEGDLVRDHAGADLTIGLINNMPDPALKATERQFMKLLQAAAGRTASASTASRFPA